MTEAPGMDETEGKRQFARIPMQVVTRLRKGSLGAGGAAREDATIGNMSRTGIFIETPARFSRDDIVEFDIRLPQEAVDFVVVGRVRWLQETGPRGIGVELVAFQGTLEEKSRLYEYIDEQIRRKRKNQNIDHRP